MQMIKLRVVAKKKSMKEWVKAYTEQMLAENRTFKGHMTAPNKVVANKKTLKDWMMSWTVMDRAITFFRPAFYEKHKEDEDFPLYGFKFQYAAKKEWESMPDNDKAPFIEKALEQLGPEAAQWARTFEKAGTTKAVIKKESKNYERQMIYDALHQAFSIFMIETVYENHLKDHPNITKEVIDAGTEHWDSMSDTDKDAYVTMVEKRWADRYEVYEHLLGDEAYKHLVQAYF